MIDLIQTPQQLNTIANACGTGINASMSEQSRHRRKPLYATTTALNDFINLHVNPLTLYSIHVLFQSTHINTPTPKFLVIQTH